MKLSFSICVLVPLVGLKSEWAQNALWGPTNALLWSAVFRICLGHGQLVLSMSLLECSSHQLKSCILRPLVDQEEFIGQFYTRFGDNHSFCQ